MQVHVLGELTARIDGRSVTPSAAKPRQILALLALRAGSVVPVSTLVDELWQERPPASARTTLQTYILQLRRLIEAALPDESSRARAKQILVTRFDGYLLDICPSHVDVQRYDSMVRSGNRAMEAGQYNSASRLLTSALATWRGPALADVPTGSALGIEAVRLEQDRLSALVNRIGADLRLGRHSALIGELSELTARHPLHEGLWSHYVLALHRCGRQRDALDAYASLRSRLVDELGIEPSPALRSLQLAVLNAGPSPSTTAHAVERNSARRRVRRTTLVHLADASPAAVNARNRPPGPG